MVKRINDLSEATWSLTKNIAFQEDGGSNAGDGRDNANNRGQTDGLLDLIFGTGKGVGPWDLVNFNDATFGGDVTAANFIGNGSQLTNLPGYINGTGDPILDSNSNELLAFNTVAAAVNHVEISNNETAEQPVIKAVGDDTNIALHLRAKGLGTVSIVDSANDRKFLNFDVSGNGNAITNTLATSATANRTQTLPDASGTIALTADIPPAQNFLASALLWTQGTQSEKADGAGVYAFDYDTDNLLANDTAFLAGWRNQGTLKASLHHNGVFEASAIAVNNDVTNTTALVGGMRESTYNPGGGNEPALDLIAAQFDETGDILNARPLILSAGLLELDVPYIGVRGLGLDTNANGYNLEITPDGKQMMAVPNPDPANSQAGTPDQTNQEIVEGGWVDTGAIISPLNADYPAGSVLRYSAYCVEVGARDGTVEFGFGEDAAQPAAGLGQITVTALSDFLSQGSFRTVSALSSGQAVRLWCRTTGSQVQFSLFLDGTVSDTNLWIEEEASGGGGGGIPPSAFNVKGDILVGTGSGTYDRLPSTGVEGHVLKIRDAANTMGLAWEAETGGGGGIGSVFEDPNPRLANNLRLDTTASALSPLASLVDGNGNEVAGFASVTSATKQLIIRNGSAAAEPRITALGDGANNSLELRASGSGNVAILDQANEGKRLLFNVAGQAAVDVTLATSAQQARTHTLPDADGELYPNKTGNSIVDSNSNELLTFSPVANAVNHIDIITAVSGNFPKVMAAGDDTDISLLLQAKGTGRVFIQDSDAAVFTRFDMGPASGGGATLEFNQTSAVTHSFPNKSGTVAHLDDISGGGGAKSSWGYVLSGRDENGAFLPVDTTGQAEVARVPFDATPVEAILELAGPHTGADLTVMPRLDNNDLLTAPLSITASNTTDTSTSFDPLALTGGNMIKLEQITWHILTVGNGDGTGLKGHIVVTSA